MVIRRAHVLAECQTIQFSWIVLIIFSLNAQNVISTHPYIRKNLLFHAEKLIQMQYVPLCIEGDLPTRGQGRPFPYNSTKCEEGGIYPNIQSN